MRLIPEWKKSWKFFSQWCFTAASALTLSWASLGTLQASIPPQYVTLIAGAITVLGFFGRLIDQSKPEPTDEQPS